MNLPNSLLTAIWTYMTYMTTSLCDNKKQPATKCLTFTGGICESLHSLSIKANGLFPAVESAGWIQHVRR